MTEIEMMQKELDAMNAKREAVKAQNSVGDDFPVIDRGFTYKKGFRERGVL